MAHNINHNELTGQDAFFSVKEKAWHGLGQIVQDYPTSAEAIQFAGLNFEVSKRPLFTYDAENNSPKTAQDGIQIPSEEVHTHFATVRTDTDQILGVVGNRYTVVQNRDAFTFFDAIVGGGDGIQYETAGALGNGERIFITAKLPGYIKIDRADLIEQYLFLTTSHDGSGAIQAAFTPIRIVCNNTLTAALKSRNNSNMITIRHTASVKEQLEQAHKVMGISYELGKQLETVFQKWSKTRITDKETRRLIDLAMAPTDVVFQAIRDKRTDIEFSKQFVNITDEVFSYAMTSPTQQMSSTAGTLFGAYNAVTGYFQNVKEFKNQSSKVESIMYGNGHDRSQKAFELCQNAAHFLS